MRRPPPFTRRRLGGGIRMPRGRRSSPRIVALCTREGTALVFRVARKLDSPNAWRKHWTLGHRLMKWWLRAFTTALATNGGFESMARYQAEGQMPPVKFRMKVTVIRQAPSRRNFIRDDDDLRYTTKPLNDALKHAGLIKDDSRRWLNQPMPVQEVSSDRHYWTVVRVEPDTEAALDELVSDMPEDAAADLRTFLGGGR